MWWFIGVNSVRCSVSSHSVPPVLCSSALPSLRLGWWAGAKSRRSPCLTTMPTATSRKLMKRMTTTNPSRTEEKRNPVFTSVNSYTAWMFSFLTFSHVIWSCCDFSFSTNPLQSYMSVFYACVTPVHFVIRDVPGTALPPVLREDQ